MTQCSIDFLINSGKSIWCDHITPFPPATVLLIYILCLQKHNLRTYARQFATGALLIAFQCYIVNVPDSSINRMNSYFFPFLTPSSACCSTLQECLIVELMTASPFQLLQDGSSNAGSMAKCSGPSPVTCRCPANRTGCRKWIATSNGRCCISNAAIPGEPPGK